MQYNAKDFVCAISLIFFLYLQHGPYVECTCALSQRSTESFRDLMVGRCLHYQTVFNPEPFCSEPKNCTQLWELFLQGLAYQAPCNTSQDGFRPFLDAAHHTTPRDKHLFWSGVYEFVSRYTYDGQKLTAIDDTLAGYLADNLQFCGSTTSTDGNEANVTSCPRCSQSAYSAFWSIASIEYAREAKGAIKVMLNASRSPAFRESSYFTTKELPQLYHPNVTSAHVMLVHRLGQTPKENCLSPSVKNLTTILTSRGIHTTCEDQPRDVVLLQCADFPESTACRDLSFTSSGSAKQRGLVVANVVLAFTSVILSLM
ncbi:ADP-ribosyl cyclase/cyclic ADP-ribose hydrolase-like [Mizuhopecten yessoensis]|uniref:ADP-ribosyl cyclase/cyclic ADP-ribose hydrolase-like n=1 Tax=Mizuhopecten yessoensis TaxID=6573 RepID=UPI000B45B648|nr:ADP-ribosyl cyclase/cyclic ADP-ribose hydrolase-like [Mizuhopecten yessoensis]